MLCLTQSDSVLVSTYAATLGSLVSSARVSDSAAGRYGYSTFNYGGPVPVAANGFGGSRQMMPQPAPPRGHGNVMYAPVPHSHSVQPLGSGGMWPAGPGPNERGMGAHAPMDAPHTQYDEPYYEGGGRPTQPHTLGAHITTANPRPKGESARRNQGRGGAKAEHMRNYDADFPALG
jgi:hypothetical protein